MFSNLVLLIVSMQLLMQVKYCLSVLQSKDVIYRRNDNSTLIHHVELPNFSMTNEDYILDFTDDAVVPKLTEHYCNLVNSLDACFRLQDVITTILHGKIYTPMLPHATLEDSRGTRTQLIEYFQQRYHYKSYLEVGCGDFSNFVTLRNLFTQVDCIDPFKENATYSLPSDVFFELRVYNNSIINNSNNNNNNKVNLDDGSKVEIPVTYDVIFIDGLHDAKQVIRDVMNALQLLNEHGMCKIYLYVCL